MCRTPKDTSPIGGTTQFIATALIDWTGDPTAPAYYLAAASLLGAGAALAIGSGPGPAPLRPRAP